MTVLVYCFIPLCKLQPQTWARCSRNYKKHALRVFRSYRGSRQGLVQARTLARCSRKIKIDPLDQLLICNAKKCHMKTVFLFSCDSHIFFIILCDLRRFIYYFSSFTCAFSFCAASFGCSAFMIADTTAIPSMFPPFSTSIFPSFSPPIATAGIGTA